MNSILHEDLLAAVEKPIELPLASFLANVGSQPGPREIQGIHEDQTEAASQTSRQQRPQKEGPLLGFGVDACEQFSVQGILDTEVDGLGWEVSQYVGPVAPPQRQDSLFLHAPLEAVDYAGVGPFLEFGVVFLSLQ